MDHSPAESFLSVSGDNYPSLFESTASPQQVMTPVSTCDTAADEAAVTPTPEGEKKPAKKRKSWGQVLPEPKTNLPPRKRAKTEDEKEQRRVERVLRNRRAAQSSRERKRQEVEALEQRNMELEKAFAESQKANQALMEELRRLRGEPPLSSLELKDNVTLSPQLFGADQKTTIDDLVNPQTQSTVNPASLSPLPTDFFEPSEPVIKNEEASTPAFEDLSVQPSASSSDVTQRPAAMLCDLQCHMSEETHQALATSQAWTSVFLRLTMMCISTSTILAACQLPANQILLSLRANLPLHPSPRILTTILSLVTRPRTSSSSLRTDLTSPSSSPRRTRSSSGRPSSSTSSRRSTTLRIKSLRKILSSSPNLARPLQDATLEAMRLVSSGYESHVADLPSANASDTTYDSTELRQCLGEIKLPSAEALMALLWALRVEERKLTRRSTIPRAAGQEVRGSSVSRKMLARNSNESPVSMI